MLLSILFSMFRRTSVVLASCFYLAAAAAQPQANGTASYRSDYAAYRSACETVPRPNVDCACVAKAHATWAHMAPDRAYAEYLLELYQQRLGLPNDADAKFKAYFVQGGSEDELLYRVSTAFESIEGADPFRDDSVRGCVIAGAPRPQLDKLPAGTFYETVYPRMLASLGNERFAQCELIETSKLMSVDAFEARTRVGNLAAPTSTATANEVGAQVMGLSLQQFDALAELEALRAGGNPIGASQREMANLEKELKEMQAGVEAQMATASSAGSPGPDSAELQAACARSGMDSAFCACFTPRFINEIVPIAGASAYMLAASALPEGFDPMQSIAFAQTMDMGVLMNVSPKVDALVDACE